MQLTKATIHIEPDDDITSIANKVKQSKARIIALVPAKRSRVMSSVVNLKLLRKMSTDVGKTVVLVSQDENIQKLAHSVGLPYSPDLKAKPIIPKGDKAEIFSGEINISAPTKKTTITKAEESVKKVVGKSDLVPAESKESSKAGGLFGEVSEAKVKKKGIKVPNFSRFRKRVFTTAFTALALIFGVGAYLYYALPEASIVITAQTRRLNISETFTINESAETPDTPFIATVQESLSDTVTQEFEASGEKNQGNKASGVITVQNCDSSISVTIAGGTGFTVEGLRYSSSSDIEIPGGTFSGGGCVSPGIAEVPVVASEAGESYNRDAGDSFAIEGFSGFVNGDGGQMTGGTDDIVKVVAQKDIDDAVALIEPRAANEIRDELSRKFGGSIVVLEGSFTQTSDAPENDRESGEVAAGGTASVTYRFSIQGVVAGDLAEMTSAKVASQLADQETVFDDGSDSLTVKSFGDEGVFTANTVGFVGPELDIETLKQELVGRRYSDAESYLESIPGVSGVTLEFSPFWVNSTPSPDKTTITVDLDERN